MNRIGIEKKEMDTPALLIDLDIMERNISTMASFFRGKKARLMIHSKVHRVPWIAHRQIESGAKGICCQKVRQAEIMAAAGIRYITLTNQVVTPSKIERLVNAAKYTDVSVSVDNTKNADDLSRTAMKEGVALGVFVDVHVGAQRFGVEPGEPALKLAKYIKSLKGLRLKGVLGNIGHISWIEPRDKRRRECERLIGLLVDTKSLMERSGISVQEISTGSTGTYDACASNAEVTEVRAGSYVLMDAGYYEHVPEFDCALTVLSTVISKQPEGIVVADAGMMSVSSAYGKPKVLGTNSLEVHELHAENTLLKLREPTQIEIGDKIEFIPSYLDATVCRQPG